MKKIYALFFFLFTLGTVFSQNNVPVPDDIIVSYQNEIQLWLSQNRTDIETKTRNFNEIELYLDPYVDHQNIGSKIFGRGGSVIGCFAIGKFLAIHEKEMIYSIAYSSIPLDIRERFYPFRNIEYFKNSLIFNPNMLFNPGSLFDNQNESSINLNNEYIYLIFYFGINDDNFVDNVFDYQMTQLINNNAKEMLILPYGYYYSLFRIDKFNNMELLLFYGVN